MTILGWLRRLGLAPVVASVLLLCSRLGFDSFRLRYALQAMLPEDPLRTDDGHLPVIDVLVPAHPKDLRVLPFSIGAVRSGCANPVRRIVLVVPGDAVGIVSAAVPDHCVVESEDQVLGEMLPWIRSHVPAAWRGWVIQQSIKLFWVMANDIPTLVLDADTVLLRPRAWVSADGRQLLCLSAERHPEYVRHAAQCWRLSRPVQAVSYVTHHQLMQPQVVRDMFPLGAASLRDWVEQADFSEHAALSEYHCYGAWLRQHRPERVVLGRFGNRGREGDELDLLRATRSIPEVIAALAREHRDRLSVSFHSWRGDA